MQFSNTLPQGLPISYDYYEDDDEPPPPPSTSLPSFSFASSPSLPSCDVTTHDLRPMLSPGNDASRAAALIDDQGLTGEEYSLLDVDTFTQVCV